MKDDGPAFTWGHDDEGGDSSAERERLESNFLGERASGARKVIGPRTIERSVRSRSDTSSASSNNHDNSNHSNDGNNY